MNLAHIVILGECHTKCVFPKIQTLISVKPLNWVDNIMCLVYKKLKVNYQSPPPPSPVLWICCQRSDIQLFQGLVLYEVERHSWEPIFTEPLKNVKHTPPTIYSERSNDSRNLAFLMNSVSFHRNIFFSLDVMIRWDFYFFNLMKLMRWNDPKEMETIFPPSVESFMELSFKESNITYSLW